MSTEIRKVDTYPRCIAPQAAPTAVAARPWRAWMVRALPSGGARLRAWSPTLLCALILAAICTHLYTLHGLRDPAESHWIHVDKLASSYHLWGEGYYRWLVGLAAGLAVAGLLLSLLAQWRPEVRRPAWIATLLASVAAVATQLLQPAFWRLGTDLPDWSWGLPVRLSLIGVAVGALLLRRRAAGRWPRWVLSGGLALLTILLLAPQPTQGRTPSPLWLYCTVHKPACNPLPESCRGELALPVSRATIPVSRLVATVPLRLKARRRLADRTALHLDRSVAPAAWRDLAGDRPFVGSGPWKAKDRELRNGQLYLTWQEVRLLALVLVPILGLVLLMGRWRRPRSHWWRALSFPLALAALVAATGLLPELSHVSALAHMPTAALLPFAVALALATPSR